MSYRDALKLEGGVCESIGVDVFFPADDADHSYWWDAKKICHTCPIEAQCLEFALVNDERFGVWGGTTPAERYRMLHPGRRLPVEEV